MIKNTLSRPYAKAAYKFSKKNFEVFRWYKMINFSIKIYFYIVSKNIFYLTCKKKIFENLFLKICKNNFNCYFKNFIKILFRDNVMNLLKNIKNMFYNYWKYDKKVITAIVYSKNFLSKNIINNISNFVKVNFFKKVFLKNIIDKSIIYGFIIKVNDIIFDNSFNCYLNKLKKYMLDV
ncbi:ATP synthase F1 subunit delta [Buchnera aphidicola]|uniref:ATP synthase F1 subunit delta n=1 Tax=Buchnera aphidicola TaxID=9 RepID=UPI0031B84F0A